MLGISGQYVTLEGSRLILLMFPLKKAHLMSGTCVIPGETFTISVPESLPAPASPLLSPPLVTIVELQLPSQAFLDLQGRR